MRSPLTRLRSPRSSGMLARCLAAALAAGALACGEDPATGPDFKSTSVPPVTATPSSLQFIVPGATPAAVTVTTQTIIEVSAASSGPCATVAPPTVVTTKTGSGNSAVFSATFTVQAGRVGDCTITFTDRKGRQAQVAVSTRPIVIELGATPIVAALYHTCALGGGGVAYCWGDNDYGRLGDGTTTDRFTPRPVSGEATFTSLTAGITHTCGITVAGEARCWGNNGIGQLGNPAAGTESHVPLAVAAPNGGPPLTFVLLTAGGQHTCGLTSDGGAWCWGRNSEGQLGDGSQQPQTAPVPVAGTLTFGTLTANANHTCGVTRAGAAYCWGSNNDGELGNGTTTFGPTPIAVSGGLWFIAVGAGGSGPFGTPHTCGITTTNATYCWGDNSSGQLGDGTTTNRLAPTLVSGAAFIQLDAGQRFTCALASGGLASCWGINLGGQLGTGDFSPRSTPTAVTGPGGGTALAFAAITAGVGHTCGRTTAAAIYCWGGNTDGQVGQDGGGTRTSPTLVSLGGPALSDLTLASTDVPLEGSTNYRAVVANPGSASNKVLQGYIYQGDGYRAAGGTVFAMSSGLSGVDFTVVASNSTAGSVTLAPGPANFVLQLLSFDGGTTYDTRTIPITITAP